MLEYHLQDISDDECLWQPREHGLRVRLDQGQWVADWPEDESYSMGPPHIAWIIWHIAFWWSMTINHAFNEGTLTRADVVYPGSVAAAKEQINNLYLQWAARLEAMTDEEWLSTDHTKWPFESKPFCELAAWLNIELMKNAAEIGYCRFLYATRT